MKRISSLEKLEKISSLSYVQSTPYKFSKNKNMSQKHIDGALAVFDWFDNLVFEAMKEEKSIIETLELTLKNKRMNIKTDLDEEYEKGVKEVLELLYNDIRG